MNINLHNYESWFQLYVDGELDSTQMAAVDAFVEKQPHLETVLEQLMQTILEAPLIAMPNKHVLLKPEQWDAENLSDWQSSLLLKLDGESKENAALSPQLQQEMQWLQKAKLANEPVIMQDKSILYSRAMRKPAVFTIARFTRIAAAAAVIAMAWLFWPEPTTIPAKEDMLARINKPAVEEPVQRPSAVVDAETNAANKPNEQEELQTAQPVMTSAPLAKTTVQVEEMRPSPAVNYSNIAKYAVVDAPVDNGISPQDRLKRPSVDTDEAAIPQVIAAVDDLQPDPIYQIEEQYTGTDEEEYLNIGGAKIKKSKIRGIMRSVSRNITRRTNAENIQQTILTR